VRRPRAAVEVANHARRRVPVYPVAGTGERRGASGVAGSNRVAAEAGTTIGDIVTNAEKIEGLMNEISTASREQSSGVGQVESAMHELDQSTQQNAALVEQTAAAASALSNQARQLAVEVGFFKLK
jgi:methyl-accepting chemotaxis protein